jgi:hypothetical protein
MNHLTDRELSIAEQCSSPSYFLQWLGYEAKKEEVQSLREEVSAVEHSTEVMQQPGVCPGGWAPRARTPAEAGNTRLESGDKAKERSLNGVQPKG